MTYLTHLSCVLVKSARFLLLYPIHTGRAYIQSNFRAIVLNTDILIKIRDFFFRISFTLTLMARPLGLEPKSNSFGDCCVTNYTTSAYGANGEDSNSRPIAYKAIALPLCYAGI